MSNPEATPWTSLGLIIARITLPLALVGVAVQVSAAQTDTLSGLRIGIEGRIAASTDNGELPVLAGDNTEDEPSMFPIKGMTGTTWTGGLTLDYLFTESDAFEHGPMLLLQVLGRDLSGSADGDSLPELDSNGNVVFNQIAHEMNAATNQLAVSLGYQITLHGFSLNASVGLLQTISVSGHEIITFANGIPPIVDPPPHWEPLGDGKSWTVESFNKDDATATSVILQASLTYTINFDRLSIELGPYYGRTFTSALIRASGSNLSIDDLGGVIQVKFEL